MDYLAILLIIPFVWASFHVLTSSLGCRKTGLPKAPPGPYPFPIIGNILELGSKPHQAVAKLSKTYGPLMTLKLGTITTIVISSPEITKEALQKNDQAFSSRTVPDMARAFNHHKNSIGWLPTNGHWRILRKASAMQIFAPKHLDATQELRRRKVQELLDHVNQSCNSSVAIDIGRAVFTSVLNSISNTFFSIDLAQHGSNLSQEFQGLICGAAEEAGRPNFADFFPVLRLVDPQGIRKRTTNYFAKVFGIFDGIINERVELRASAKGPKASNDVLDSLLSLTEEDNSEMSCHDIKHLLLVIHYLFKTFLHNM